MSTKGPKTKNSEKIKFFKIDGEGDIKEAFPQKPEGTQGFDEGTREHIDPIFEPEEPSAPGKESSLSLKIKSNRALEQQIHLLQPQVEDISKIPQKHSLTTDQADILRKYIALKESEVRDVREQLRQYETYLKKLSAQLESANSKNQDLVRDIDSLRRKHESLSVENRNMKDKYKGEINLLKSDFEDKLHLSENVEARATHLSREQEEWRQKVKEDLKRIKLKERELENKYELLKRDSQALLDSKDQQLLELKKKTDALDLELEAMEDRLRNTNFILNAIDSKKARLVETMKLAISLLEEIDQVDEAVSDDDEQKAG